MGWSNYTLAVPWQKWRYSDRPEVDAVAPGIMTVTLSLILLAKRFWHRRHLYADGAKVAKCGWSFEAGADTLKRQRLMILEIHLRLAGVLGSALVYCEKDGESIDGSTCYLMWVGCDPVNLSRNTPSVRYSNGADSQGCFQLLAPVSRHHVSDWRNRIADVQFTV